MVDIVMSDTTCTDKTWDSWTRHMAVMRFMPGDNATDFFFGKDFGISKLSLKIILTYGGGLTRFLPLPRG